MMEQWLGPTDSHELILIQGLGEPVKFLSSGAQRRNKVNSLSEAETLHKFNHSFLPGRWSPQASESGPEIVIAHLFPPPFFVLRSPLLYFWAHIRYFQSKSKRLAISLCPPPPSFSPIYLSRTSFPSPPLFTHPFFVQPPVLSTAPLLPAPFSFTHPLSVSWQTLKEEGTYYTAIKTVFRTWWEQILGIVENTERTLMQRSAVSKPKSVVHVQISTQPTPRTPKFVQARDLDTVTRRIKAILFVKIFHRE